MKTNLDVAQKYFDKASYDSNNDTYRMNKEYTIEWLANGEAFVVDRVYFDNEIGYVTDLDLFSGDFRQCLEFCLGRKIDAQDVAELEKVKAG